MIRMRLKIRGSASSARPDEQAHAEAQPGDLWEMRTGFADPPSNQRRWFSLKTGVFKSERVLFLSAANGKL